MTDLTSPEQELERLTAQELLIERATEKILELMELQGVSKAEMARRLGKSRAFMTQIMDGSRNMTLRTLADLASALDHELNLTARPTHATVAIPMPPGRYRDQAELRPVRAYLESTLAAEGSGDYHALERAWNRHAPHQDASPAHRYMLFLSRSTQRDHGLTGEYPKVSA